MPLPHELLQAIQTAVDNVLDEGELNPQQLTFVKHIQKTAWDLSRAVEAIPQTDYALHRILPTLGDSFLQQQVALFGYARLLVEQAQSFGGAVLSTYQQEQMQIIYQQGQFLYQLTEQVIAEGRSQRQRQYLAPPTTIDLAVFLADETPILQYSIRNHPVHLSVTSQSIMLESNAYHLAALLEHIVKTISHELIEYGHIKISTEEFPYESMIAIFATGIQLDTREIDILFKQNGRYLYPQRFEKDGGQIRFLRESGRGASIQLVFPPSKL